LGSRSPGDRLLPRQRTAEQATIDALARIGASSVPALVDVLHDPDPELRRDAARALARIGSDAREAVPELIAALDDKDAGVRSFATRALGEIGPAAGKAVPALIKELRQNAKAAEQAAKAAAAAAAEEPATGAVPIAK
jgi:HEAT repeat protein